MSLLETPRHAIEHHRGHLSALATDVAYLPLSMVNVAFIGNPGGGDRSWYLVDAGLATSAAAIKRAAAERFGPKSRPAAILLTHGHFDHVGSLPRLAQYWRAPVYAHPLEFPYLTGRASYPPPDPSVGGGAMAWLSPLYPRGPITLTSELKALPEGGEIPGLPDWRWIHTPGHAPGHVSFFREHDRLLIAGDAFVTTRQESALAVLTQEKVVWRPPAYYTTDWRRARESIAALAKLYPDIAVTGHGPAMQGEELAAGLRWLNDHFDEVQPRHGHYLVHPATADENGPTYDARSFASQRAAIATAASLAALALVAVYVLCTMPTRSRR